MFTSEENVVWLYAGKHRLCDLGGIAVVECHDEIYLADAEIMTKFFDEVIDRAGIFLLLLSLRDGGRPGAAARKHLVDWTGNQKGAVACAGGPTGLHIFASLLNRAVRLLHGNTMPMQMFKHEAPAIAWLREQQRKAQRISRISHPG